MVRYGTIEKKLHKNHLFDVDAREYNGKWYNQVRAWKVERTKQNMAQNSQATVPLDDPLPPMPETDDLPFGKETEPPF